MNSLQVVFMWFLMSISGGQQGPFQTERQCLQAEEITVLKNTECQYWKKMKFPEQFRWHYEYVRSSEYSNRGKDVPR